MPTENPDTITLHVLYFAHLRETIGTRFETITTPARNVQALVDDLQKRNASYAAAFANTGRLCVAVEQTLATFTTPLADGQEIAFFPPMTGG